MRNDLRRHNQRLDYPRWHERYHWSRWSRAGLKVGINRAALLERYSTERGAWWFWFRVRSRMVDFYLAKFGWVPDILLSRRLPKWPSGLAQDREFARWYREK